MDFKSEEKHSFFFMKKLSITVALIISFVIISHAQSADTLKQNGPEQILTKVDIEAKFPGGDAAWNLYVQQALERKIDKLVRDKRSFGTCEMQFIVDKEGKISNVEALSLKESLLAKILTRILIDSPKWEPAEQDGRKVKAWRRQKVTFRPPSP
ncbi:MAG: energy transducer TonB [Chitinophagaceae bacterium]